jgi:hypothetical protein
MMICDLYDDMECNKLLNYWCVQWMHFDLARAKRCLVMSQRRSNVCPFLHSTCFFQVLSSDSAGEARQSEGVEGDDSSTFSVAYILLSTMYSIILFS